MALADHLDIINAACVAVGESPLGSDGLDEESDIGRQMALAYYTVLDFNLGLYLFSWSLSLVQLSVIDDATPLSGYTYVFDYPAEAIGEPIYITDDPTSSRRRFGAYRLQDNGIHCSTNPLYAQIRTRPLVRRWSPLFKAATITALSASLALSQREDQNLHDQLYKRAYGSPADGFRGGEMGAAMRADAFSQPPRKPNWDDNPLTRAWSADATGSEADD